MAVSLQLPGKIKFRAHVRQLRGHHLFSIGAWPGVGTPAGLTFRRMPTLAIVDQAYTYARIQAAGWLLPPLFVPVHLWNTGVFGTGARKLRAARAAEAPEKGLVNGARVQQVRGGECGPRRVRAGTAMKTTALQAPGSPVTCSPLRGRGRTHALAKGLV